MKILKRNQIIISVLALMLITVGYMSYTSNINNSIETGVLMDAETMADIGDARLVNSSNVSENGENGNSGIVPNSSDNENNENASSITDTENNKESSVKTDESATTSATDYGTDYFVASKLERDKMYSQMLETYKGLAENSAVSAEQKNISTQEFTNINNQKNSIMIAEDVVIFVNDNSTSVVIKAEKLEDADIAQIQNIVCREIGVEADAIHISLK